MKSNPRVDIGLLVLRAGLGLVLMYFGSQKLFGLFGGNGPGPTIEMFHTAMGIPAPFTVLAMVAEFFGGLGLVVGLATPVAAFGTACTMGVATYFNWRTPGAIPGLLRGNAEDSQKLFLSLVILVGCLSILCTGAGSYSLDAKLFLKKRVKR